MSSWDDPPWGERPAECKHEDTWFDRTICPEPCGGMHYYCQDCGVRIGECSWAEQGLFDNTELRALLNDLLDAVTDYVTDVTANIGREPRELVALRQRTWQYLSGKGWLGGSD